MRLLCEFYFKDQKTIPQIEYLGYDVCFDFLSSSDREYKTIELFLLFSIDKKIYGAYLATCAYDFVRVLVYEISDKNILSDIIKESLHFANINGEIEFVRILGDSIKESSYSCVKEIETLIQKDHWNKENDDDNDSPDDSPDDSPYDDVVFSFDKDTLTS